MTTPGGDGRTQRFGGRLFSSCRYSPGVNDRSSSSTRMASAGTEEALCEPDRALASGRFLRRTVSVDIVASEPSKT
jgi:hypothetical protein